MMILCGDKIVERNSFAKYKQFVDNCFAICPRQTLHAQTLGFVLTTEKNCFRESGTIDATGYR